MKNKAIVNLIRTSANAPEIILSVPEHKAQIVVNGFSAIARSYGHSDEDVQNFLDDGFFDEPDGDTVSIHHSVLEYDDTVEVELYDLTGRETIGARFKSNAYGVDVFFDGHEVQSEENGAPLYIEFYDGQVNLRVWDDVRKEDCKSLSLKDARKE